ncbi:MAG: HD domain-containing protein, partial [Sphaerochaetaceae bacterium]|nr:HD domain-containing protein [Sphaerochaetaceae bacterium]
DINTTFLHLALELGEIISKTSDNDRRYQELISKISSTLGFGYAEVWKRNEDNILVKTEIVSVLDKDLSGFASESNKYSFSMGEGIPGISWQQQRPLWIRNVQQDERFLKKTVAHTYGLKTGITMPVFAYEYLDAVCFFFTKEMWPLDQTFLDVLSHLSKILGASIMKDNLENEVAAILRKQEYENRVSIRTMNKIFALRDPYTISHQEEVASLARAIGRSLGLDQDSLQDLTLGGLLHDIGKIETPQEILSKPGQLNAEEFSLVKRHPFTGYSIIKDAMVSDNVKRIVLEHHEREDGSGYPNGLHGDDIHYLSKIIAVADVISAMRSHRPYRPALPLEVVLSELNKVSGTKLDERIVEQASHILQSA